MERIKAIYSNNKIIINKILVITIIFFSIFLFFKYIFVFIGPFVLGAVYGNIYGASCFVS